MPQEADSLRTVEHACEPDSRTKLLFGGIGVHTGMPRSITLAEEHAHIACYALNPTVPEDIAIHFETAKNLYLYAWLVYRFYPVAEQQARGSVEFALRERQPEFVKKYSEKRCHDPTLRPLLENAIKEGLVKNEDFPSRELWAYRIAESRYRHEVIARAGPQGLNETADYSHVQPTEEDLNHDWLGDFLETIPSIRNEYAHGSGMPYPFVLHTFEVVTVIINQFFPAAQIT